MGWGPGMRSGGVCTPSATALTVTPIRLQFSCASLDAVVDYFVSHTNKALVPFLLDEDYEKVLGACSLRELRGAQYVPLRLLPPRATPGSMPGRRTSSRTTLCSRPRGGG